MSIIRIYHNRENPFVQLNKAPLNDPNISLRAKGLWAYCLSKPDDWVFSIRQLASVLKEGEKALYTIVKELINNNYVIKLQYKDVNNQKFERVEYTFMEFQMSEEEKALFIQEIQKKFTLRPFGKASTRHLLRKKKNKKKKNEEKESYEQSDPPPKKPKEKQSSPSAPLVSSSSKMEGKEKKAPELVEIFQACGIKLKPKTAATWLHKFGLARVLACLDLLNIAKKKPRNCESWIETALRDGWDKKREWSDCNREECVKFKRLYPSAKFQINKTQCIVGWKKIAVPLNLEPEFFKKTVAKHFAEDRK